MNHGWVRQFPKSVISSLLTEFQGLRSSPRSAGVYSKEIGFDDQVYRLVAYSRALISDIWSSRIRSCLVELTFICWLVHSIFPSFNSDSSSKQSRLPDFLVLLASQSIYTGMYYHLQLPHNLLHLLPNPLYAGGERHFHAPRL